MLYKYNKGNFCLFFPTTFGFYIKNQDGYYEKGQKRKRFKKRN